MTDQFHDALEQMGPECPFCQEDRQIERVGNVWVCAVCGKDFPVLSVNDRRFLKGIHVEPKD